MTRFHAKTIPAAFIRLDATMSDADAYVNVRDMQVRAENHNKLLACRARQPMFALSFWDNTNGRDPLIYKALGIMPEQASAGPPPTCIMRVPIWVPPWCQSATLVARLAYSNASGINVKCYGLIDAAGTVSNAPTTATLTVASAIDARYAGAIAVPPDAAVQGAAMFSLYADGTIYGADIKGGAHNAISDVGLDSGRPYIDIATGSGASEGYAIYILDSGSAIRTDIAPRLIVESVTAGGAGSDDRFYLDQPFNRPPLVGSDLADARAVQGLKLHSLSLWPARIADFDAGVEMP